MLRASEKMLVKKIVFGKIGLILLIVLVAFLAKGVWGVYQKSSYAKDNRERAEQELNDLHAREGALTEELSRLDTPRGLEEEIRHKFDVGHEGEQLIVLVDAPEPEVPPQVYAPSVWERLVDFLGF